MEELYKKNEIENLSFEQILEREGAGEEETNETVGQTLYDPDVQTTHLNNILLGNDTGRLITTGHGNTFVGFQAGFSDTTGSNNFFAGEYAGKNNTVGYNNCFIGTSAGLYSVLGYNNTAIGNAAMQGAVGLNGDEHDNTVIGFAAGWVITSAYDNIAIGNSALGGQLTPGVDTTTGSYNVCIGKSSGANLTGGNSNTFIGNLTGASASTSNGNVFLGTMAGYYETGSNKLFIDALTRNTEAEARVKSLIYGIFASTTANQHLYLNSNVYISDTLTIGGTAISSLYQPLDSDLTAIAGLSSADGNIIVGSAGGWVAESGATARTSLGLAIGTNVQAYNSYLTGIDQDVSTAGSPNFNLVQYLTRINDASTGPVFGFQKKRTTGGNVIDGDSCGTHSFSGWISDGYYQFAQIMGEVDGTPGAGDYPGRIVFLTTTDGAAAPSEKARLDNAGNFNVVGEYRVDGVKVVSNRVVDARCDDAINSGDATTDGVIDALRDAMISHGLISSS